MRAQQLSEARHLRAGVGQQRRQLFIAPLLQQLARVEVGLGALLEEIQHGPAVTVPAVHQQDRERG
jgi:hypothetical protein